MQSNRDDKLQQALQLLEQLLGDRVTTAHAERDSHGRGEAYHPVFPPDAVCFPRSTAEVAEILRICHAIELPVIAFGAGTSLEGHVAALHGGLSVDLSRMDAVLNVCAGDLDATVQAGVTRQQLNSYLRDTGLFFPVDPGAEATIGGMVATRASGTNAVRYGTMRENVVRLTVVLADGRILQTGSRAKKSAAGYDLTRLFVGSEGTLGIITEITVRLHGRPESEATAISAFPTTQAAVSAAIFIVQSGIAVARMELVDANGIIASNKYSKTTFNETPTLFFEFHGTQIDVDDQAERVRKIVVEEGATEFVWERDVEAREKLWHARHNLHYAISNMRPGARLWGTDVCVPISRLADCIALALEDSREMPFYVAVVGHVGDGNFHVTYVVDPGKEDEMRAVGVLSERLVRHAIAADGTCTGEHGIGYGKIKYMEAEHGATAVDVMRAIKQALDPLNILNPGKILPEG